MPRNHPLPFHSSPRPLRALCASAVNTPPPPPHPLKIPNETTAFTAIPQQNTTYAHFPRSGKLARTPKYPTHPSAPRPPAQNEAKPAHHGPSGSTCARSRPPLKILHQRHLIPRLVIPHVVDHSLGHEDAEAAGAG